MDVEETERRLVERWAAGGGRPQEALSVGIFELLLMLQPILYGFFVMAFLGIGLLDDAWFLFAWSWQSGQ